MALCQHRHRCVERSPFYDLSFAGSCLRQHHLLLLMRVWGGLLVQYYTPNGSGAQVFARGDCTQVTDTRSRRKRLHRREQAVLVRFSLV